MTVSKKELKKLQISIEDILSWTGGNCSAFPSGTICKGLFTDSRQVVSEGLFVALTGEHFNGNHFAIKALQQGATAALVSEPITEIPGKIVIYVPDTLEALQKIAHEYRKRFQTKCIAITGSVGKTTTKDLLAWCLGKKYPTLKTIANHNNDIGVPETLMRLDQHVQFAIIEMGMRALGEIERLSKIVEPDAVLITNIAPVHLETLGSLENIAQAKCEIFSAVKPEGWGMIAGDNPLLMEKAQKYKCKIYTFGKKSYCDCHLVRTEIHEQGMELQIQIFQKEISLTFPIPSEAIAMDVVAAAGCAYLCGMTLDEIQMAWMDYIGDEQRLHIRHFPEGGVIINDTYNANPSSMEAALEVLVCQKVPGKRVAVLGDMYELGSMEREGHLKIGQKVAKMPIDLLVTIGELGKMFAKGAQMGNMSEKNIQSFADKESALPWLQAHVTYKDAVLFKASHGLHLDILLEQWETRKKGMYE